MSRIKCAVLYSGFPAMHTECHKEKEGSEKETNRSIVGLFDGNIMDQKVDLPSIHFIGEKDTSVPPKYGEKLAKQFCACKTYVHSKGHVIPQDVESCNQIISFLDTYCSVQSDVHIE